MNQSKIYIYLWKDQKSFLSVLASKFNNLPRTKLEQEPRPVEIRLSTRTKRQIEFFYCFISSLSRGYIITIYLCWKKPFTTSNMTMTIKTNLFQEKKPIFRCYLFPSQLFLESRVFLLFSLSSLRFGLILTLTHSASGEFLLFRWDGEQRAGVGAEAAVFQQTPDHLRLGHGRAHARASGRSRV